MKRLLPLAALAFVALQAFADVPFIEDDFARAASQAKAKNVPLFVETWAPW
jgi:hypothetical protein